MAKTTNDANGNLKQVLSDIEKQFGKGSIMRLGDSGTREIDVISIWVSEDILKEEL